LTAELYYERMNWDKLQGKFVVIDGPDGAGKSTQVDLLKEFISNQGLAVVSVRDPGGTRIGDKIRAVLLDNQHTEISVRCEALLYMASRAQLYHQVIRPALSQGKCVVCDRWVSSTYAYQAIAGKTGAEMVLEVAEAALERTWPDLTVIIDVPGSEGLGRIEQEFDRMENKPEDFHCQVRDAFLELSRKQKNFKVVDGTKSIEAVHSQIIEIVRRYVDP